MKKLTGLDLLALGFMTLALFLGAGNIIYPPLSGLQQGGNAWYFALGFLVTAVGLPVLTIMALARVSGTIQALSQPIGRFASVIFAVVCYLFVGPLFATPRTTTVSFEIGIEPFLGPSLANSPWPLCFYSLAYFMTVMLISFYPGRLLDSVGKLLAPIKVLAVLLLGISAFVVADRLLEGQPLQSPDSSSLETISAGISEGYLTMDTLGALVFGIVIVRAIQSRGVTEPRLITRYAIYAGLMAGAGLAAIYIPLFKLGMDSQYIAAGADTGARILSQYVKHVFGMAGNFILAFLIIIACLVTAVGLTCACSEYFSKLLKLPEKLITVVLVIFSLLISNLGLNHLISVSKPILVGLGPLCVVLVVLSFGNGHWYSRRCVIMPSMLAALIFGILQMMRIAQWCPEWMERLSWLPLYAHHLEWVLPVAIAAILSIAADRIHRQCARQAT